MRPDFSELISKEEALSRLFSSWSPRPVKAEMVPLEEAAGRVLYEDQYALYNLPVVRASAMDGIRPGFSVKPCGSDVKKGILIQTVSWCHRCFVKWAQFPFFIPLFPNG